MTLPATRVWPVTWPGKRRRTLTYRSKVSVCRGVCFMCVYKELWLTRLETDDIVRYTCVARNLAGETEKNIDLQVQGQCILRGIYVV